MIDLVSGLFKSVFELMSGVVGFVLGGSTLNNISRFLGLALIILLLGLLLGEKGSEGEWEANRRYV